MQAAATTPMAGLDAGQRPSRPRDALRVAGAEPAVWMAPGSRFPDLVDLVS